MGHDPSRFLAQPGIRRELCMDLPVHWEESSSGLSVCLGNAHCFIFLSTGFSVAPHTLMGLPMIPFIFVAKLSAVLMRPNSAFNGICVKLWLVDRCAYQQHARAFLSKPALQVVAVQRALGTVCTFIAVAAARLLAFDRPAADRALDILGCCFSIDACLMLEEQLLLPWAWMPAAGLAGQSVIVMGRERSRLSHL